MKDLCRTLFRPLLDFFDTGDVPQGYRPSHRTILLAMGALFFTLSAVSLFFGLLAGSAGALIPILFFFAVSVVCGVIGWLGSDGAVAKIWGIK